MLVPIDTECIFLKKKKTMCRFGSLSPTLFLCHSFPFSLSYSLSHSSQLSLPQSLSLSVVLFSHRPLQFPFRVNKFMHAKVQSVKCTTGLRYAMRIASAFRLCAPCVLCYGLACSFLSTPDFVSCTQICFHHTKFSTT